MYLELLGQESEVFYSGLTSLAIWPFVAFVLLVAVLLYRRRVNVDQREFDSTIREQAKFLHEVESVAQVGGWRMDRDFRISAISPQARSILEVGNDLNLPDLDSFAGLFPQDQRHVLMATLKNASANSVDFDIDMPIERKPEELAWLRILGEPTGNNGELICAVQDITDRKEAEELIEFQANFDSLTGLPNRLLFRDRLRSAMTKANRSKSKLAVLFIDLDNFKAVNDHYGHSAGDHALVETARRIRSCIRESDTVARYSGDEFTVILHDISGPSGIYKIVENVVARLWRPFEIEGVGDSQIRCGASVGVALYPDDATDIDALLIKADQAMYEVKRSGRNGWHFYTKEIQQKSEHRHQLYNELLCAIGENRLAVHFQPIVELENKQVVSCEALARWQKADGGWISAGDFVSIAEQTGIIDQIDLQVLENAISDLSAINKQRDKPISLWVNISPRIFIAKDGSLKQWLSLIRGADKDVSIMAEISDTLLVDDPAKVQSMIQRLTSANVGIVIDDFGASSTSLGHLAALSIDSLKIDRSIINGIGKSKSDEKLIEAIGALGKALGIAVIGQGVETSEQMKFLRDKGCTHAQGYFVGMPMSKTALRDFLNESSASAS